MPPPPRGGRTRLRDGGSQAFEHNCPIAKIAQSHGYSPGSLVFAQATRLRDRIQEEKLTRGGSFVFPNSFNHSFTNSVWWKLW